MNHVVQESKINTYANFIDDVVKHVQLWNVAFQSTSPRWIHSVYLAAIVAYYARYIPILMLLLVTFDK